MNKHLVFILAGLLVFSACQHTPSEETESTDPIDPAEEAIEEAIQETLEEEESFTLDEGEQTVEGDLQTYVNSSIGLQLSLPSDWEVSEDEHGRPYVSFVSAERMESQIPDSDATRAIDAILRVYSSLKELPNNEKGTHESLDAWLNKDLTYFGDAKAIEEITVDEQKAYRVSDSYTWANEEVIYWSVWFEHNGMFMSLTLYPSSTAEEAVLQSIVDSIELISI